ncbi:MAG: DNA strand exchange inhibitor protein [Phycisphaerae bacterium]|nr:DNA strand exchange inhibitor protein [Phycisphaerae bacterium]
MDRFTLEKIQFDAVRGILAGFCSCKLGKSAAARLTPSIKLDVIQKSLNETSQMVEVIRDIGLPPFGGVTDISRNLSRVKPAGGADAEDFAQIASTLDGISTCHAFMLKLPERFDLLHALGKQLGDFSHESAAIRQVVSSDGTVRDDASPKLAELRREIAAVTQQIHDVIHQYVRDPEIRKLLTGTNVTVHGDRYVLPVRADHRGRLPGVVHRSSHSGQTVFVEPNASVTLNNRLVDLQDNERAEISRLLAELGIKITAKSRKIESSLKAMGKIDLVSGKAQYSYQFDMTAPEISQQGGMELFQVQHPLLTAQAWEDKRAGKAPEESIDVVPINVRLGSDFDILVITGSNTGGKTVTLKTVALMAVMAQSGMHLPAQRGAKVPLFTDVLIEIGDEQSLEQSLSTFGGHVERLKHIFANADKSTLVLLDELGSGTDPDEGGAIGQAVLDELRRIGCLAMVTTHFSILKAYAMNHDRVDNASVEFDTQTLRPAYHLNIGTPGESHAISVAEKLGLPKNITALARKHLGKRGGQFRKAMRVTGEARRNAEDARAGATAAKIEAENQARVYETKLADLDGLKRDLTQWLARLTEMKAGDEIPVPASRIGATGKIGKLVRIEFHKQQAVIDVDKLQLEIPLTELMPDIGQQQVRKQLAAERQTQASLIRDAEADQAAAKKLREQAEQAQKLHTARAKQFDMWLGAIARVKVGDDVPINQRPGCGKVTAFDLPGMHATVEVEGGKTMRVSLQDLFPQIGPFAPKAPAGNRSRQQRRPGDRNSADQSQRAGQGRGKPRDVNRPIPHGKTQGKPAAENRKALLATKPGEKVFVVPFNTAATLVRIDEGKDQITVQRGAFEMQVKISDCEPVGYGKDKRK